MTSHKDLERAKELAAILQDEGDIELVCDVTLEPAPSAEKLKAISARIDDDGVQKITSLIAQVRNETLDAAEDKLAELEKFYANRNGVKTESEVGRIIGVQDAMLEIRNLKQEDKE